MNKNMIQNAIDKQLDSLQGNAALKDRYRAGLLEQSNLIPVNTTMKRRRHPFVVIVAIILCLALSVPVLGATVPAYNRFLHKISPDLAQFLRPVDAESSSEGISVRMESAITDGENTMLTIAIQDTLQDRFPDIADATQYEIYCQLNFEIAEYPANGTYYQAYDRETKTVYFFFILSHTGLREFKQTSVHISDITVFSQPIQSHGDMPLLYTIHGDWTLSVDLEAVPTRDFSVNAQVGGLSIETFKVSPIMLSVMCTGKNADGYLSEQITRDIICDIQIRMLDGSIKTYGFAILAEDGDIQIDLDRFTAQNGYAGVVFSSYPINNGCLAQLFFQQPLDLSQVDTIVITFEGAEAATVIPFNQ